MYDGPERRKNTMDGEHIIIEIDNRLTKLETKFDERWINHDKSTNDRQSVTCKKLDEIKESISQTNDRLSYLDKTISGVATLTQANFTSLDKTTNSLMFNVNERITKLPCESRKNWYSSMATQVKVIWGIMTLIIGAVFVEWIKKK